jgi:hypothetical protein
VLAVRSFAVCGLIKSHPNTSKQNASFTIFELDWFDLRFYFWIALDTITHRFNDISKQKK